MEPAAVADGRKLRSAPLCDHSVILADHPAGVKLTEKRVTNIIMILTKKTIYWILPTLLLMFPTLLLASTLLYDDFIGNIVSSNNWHIPTWVSPNDGTFIGRTQFRCTQNSSLPSAKNSNAIITVETYNPTGFSFYGTDLISNQAVSLTTGIHITIRAKMDTSTRGIVGGIFLYALKPGSSTLHDEIDFELITNLPNGVQTNIYNNEQLGVGHPEFVTYSSGTIIDYHTYEIKWLPNKVSWFVDGNLVRTDISNVPTGPMHFHFNLWVPGKEWSEAYSASLQPTASESSNQIFSMYVDYIRIQSFIPTHQENNIVPILPLLIIDDSP